MFTMKGTTRYYYVYAATVTNIFFYSLFISLFFCFLFVLTMIIF